jgi:peptidoglycan/LPS O-acetylase OafA/YrhL
MVHKKIKDADHNRIKVLDGWRTLSVALVIFSHALLFSGTMRLDPSGFAAREIFIPIVPSLGALGVDIFFVISGFVICRGFLKEVDETGRVSLPAFYTRRFFRIVPPLVIYLAVVFTLAWFGVVQLRIGTAVRALTFTCNFPSDHTDCGGQLAQHTWSLSVEEQFYLVIPVLFVAFANNRRTVITGLALTLAACVFGLAVLGLTVAAAFLANFVFIGAGVACALNEEKIRHVVGALPAWTVYPMLVLLVPLARANATRIWPVPNIPLAVVITVLLIQTMVKPSRLRDFLLLPAMRDTGRASYGIYLWQQLALNAGVSVPFYALTLPVCLAWCFASFKWFERPLIRLGARFSNNIKAHT